MKKEKIPEIILRHTTGQTDEDQRRMLFDTMFNEVEELNSLSGEDFKDRVAKTIANHPERFSRKFSFAPITSQERVYLYSVIVSFQAKKYSSRYGVVGFWLGLERGYRSSNITLTIATVEGAKFAGRAKESDVNFGILEGIVVTELNNDESDLVLSYLHQGYQRALEEIKSEIIKAMNDALNKKDAVFVFGRAKGFLGQVKILTPQLDDKIEELRDANRQITDLKTTIAIAIKDLEGSKGISKSSVFQDIRERLELVLNPQEPRRGLRIRS